MSSDVSASIREQVASVGFWWHSIDLGHGIITPGNKSVEQQAQELESMKLPGLRGKTVLDIGAWDGFFSFEAERRGAARVVALDYHAWHSDTDKLFKHRAQRQATGHGEHESEITDIWHEHDLPGKRGFDLAREIRKSRVDSFVADFMEADVRQIGTFDVTFFLGVLYHLRNPLKALERLALLTGELAIIESEAVVIPGFERAALCEFYETNELNDDPSNWWAPTEAALVGMCRAAGFRRAESLNKPPTCAKLAVLKTVLGHGLSIHYRAFVHAWR